LFLFALLLGNENFFSLPIDQYLFILDIRTKFYETSHKNTPRHLLVFTNKLFVDLLIIISRTTTRTQSNTNNTKKEEEERLLMKVLLITPMKITILLSSKDEREKEKPAPAPGFGYWRSCCCGAFDSGAKKLDA